jgi:hypothetical protein
MKLRSFLSGLLAIVVVLLLIGAGGLYWITASSPLKLLTAGAGEPPKAAIFVPRQAPAMVSLLVNPDDLKAFRQVIAHPGQRRQARAEFTQFQRSLLANTGLEYERDVQSWLGDEVTLAVTTLDIDRDLTNGKQPGYLLAIATQDPEQSREFLQVFWQKRAIAGTDLTFEQYKGVKLIYNEVPVAEAENRLRRERSAERGQKAGARNQRAEEVTLSPNPFLPTPSLASAVVGDQFVLFANDVKVLRDAITNVQAAELNLDSAKFYQQALKTLTQPRIGLTFVNLPGVAGWLETESITPAKVEQERAKIAGAKSAQTLVMTWQLAKQGLIAETATVGNGTTAIAPTLSKPVAALNYIPATSPLAAAGTNLNQLWTELDTTLTHYSTVAQLVNQSLQDLEKQRKINLPKDIFSWVTGEYALARVSAPSAESGNRQPTSKKRQKADSFPAEDWVFVAERGVGESAKAAIAHLDEVAKQQGYSVGAVPIGEQTVLAWTKLTPKNWAAKTLEAEVQGVHTTVGQYEIFASSLAAMEQALTVADASLVNGDRFQTAIAPFQRPNNGYLYLDWSASRPILEQRLPFLKVIELAGSPLFNHLQSLSLSSYGRQDGVQRSSIFIQLQE